MNTLPEKWYIQLTPENYDEVKAWWVKQVEKSVWRGRHLDRSFIVLSKHPTDESHCWLGPESTLNKWFSSYKKITLEEFRKITKPMNTLPTKWYIGVTEENRDELNRWRQRVATSCRDHELLPYQHTILSKHIDDGSCYYASHVQDVRQLDDYKDYQEITLEQFRQITNQKPMNTHPEKWYIVATEDNYDELKAWRQTRATSYLDLFRIGHPLLSHHPMDNSYYYGGSVDNLRCNSDFNGYQEITIEQFRQITNPNQKPMTKTIQIPHSLLIEYYEASTTPQKEYLTKHFKLDGTTTDEAIRGLYEMACVEWKPKIKANHPDCFPEDNKYFDFSKHTNQHGCDSIVSDKVAHSLGLCRDFIQVRAYSSNGKYYDRSFYLHSEYNWELAKDGGVMVLIPTKKVK